MANDALISALSHLVSEQQNPETLDLDLLPAKEILKRLNQEDKLVSLAVEKVLPQIAQAVEKISSAFKRGGRLVFQGAGTSGRLGVIEATECPPLFGISNQMILGIMAGGKEAMFTAQESAEDSPTLGMEDLKAIEFSRNDILVATAASGRTPYVIGALEYANKLGSKTISISSSPDSPVAKLANIAICPVVGPEALSGLTRLKSGSAQKMILNMLTTASMIRLGKSYKNLMVDAQGANNTKFRARAVRIVMQATDCDKDVAKALLLQSDYNAKVAILMHLTGIDAEQAKEKLSESDGFLRKAIKDQ